MEISKFFKEKELTDLEKRQREALKEKKKLRRKFLKNPLKVIEFMEEGYKLMDKWVEEGLMTEEEREKEINQISKDMEKATKIMSGFRR